MKKVFYAQASMVIFLVLAISACVPSSVSDSLQTSTPSPVSPETATPTETTTLTYTPTLVFTPSPQPPPPDLTPGQPLPVSCGDGEYYLAMHQYDMARQIFTVILTAEPQARCAVIGLGQIPAATSTSAPTPTSTVDPYGVVSGLVSFGAYDAAATQIVNAVVTAPADARISDYTGQPWMIWETVKTNVLPLGITLVFLVAVVWYYSYQQRLHVDIKEFDVDTVKLAGVEGDKPNVRLAILSDFDQAMCDLCTTNPLSKPDLIDQPLGLPDLPNITSIPEEVKDLWTFLTKAFPANVVTVKGHLDYDPGNGPALTVLLVQNRTSNIWGTTTISMRDINPDYESDGTTPTLDDYLKLVQPAAIWVYWQVYGRGFFAARRLRNSFGTDNPQSYIALKMAERYNGEYCRIEGKSDEKQKKGRQIKAMLMRALECDAHNRIAYLNLGTLLYFMSQEKDGLAAKEDQAKVTDAEINLKRARSLSGKTDPTYIHSCYLLALIEIDRYLASKRNSPESHMTQEKGNTKRPALEEARRLLNTAWRAAKRAKIRNSNLFTDDYTIMIEIPFKDVCWWQKPNDKHDPLEGLIEQGSAAPRVLYNLACHCSLAVELIGMDVDEYLRKALNLLKDAFEVKNVYAMRAKDDLTLEMLRKKKKEEFTKLTKDYMPQSAPQVSTVKPSFAYFVDPVTASSLKDKGIVTPAELLQKAANHKDRTKLAADCAINEDDLLHYTQAAELSRISGIEFSHICLFYKANVRSLFELAHYSGREKYLLADLNLIKPKTKLDVQVPDETKLIWWTKLAKKTYTIVEVPKYKP